MVSRWDWGAPFREWIRRSGGVARFEHCGLPDSMLCGAVVRELERELKSPLEDRWQAVRMVVEDDPTVEWDH